jgi:hypothetical protein
MPESHVRCDLRRIMCEKTFAAFLYAHKVCQSSWFPNQFECFECIKRAQREPFRVCGNYIVRKNLATWLTRLINYPLLMLLSFKSQIYLNGSWFMWHMKPVAISILFKTKKYISCQKIANKLDKQHKNVFYKPNFLLVCYAKVFHCFTVKYKRKQSMKIRTLMCITAQRCDHTLTN